MVNKPKQQGTTEETWNKRYYEDDELFATERLAEGGMFDPGDVLIRDRATNTPLVMVESKHRQAANAHKMLDKATAKTAGSVFAGIPTVFAWKRTVRKPGNKKRSADGVPRIVCMEPDVFRELLRRAYGPASRRD